MRWFLLLVGGVFFYYYPLFLNKLILYPLHSSSYSMRSRNLQCPSFRKQKPKAFPYWCALLTDICTDFVKATGGRPCWAVPGVKPERKKHWAALAIAPLQRRGEEPLSGRRLLGGWLQHTPRIPVLRRTKKDLSSRQQGYKTSSTPEWTVRCYFKNK